MIQYLNAYGVNPVVTSGFRSREDQQRLYDLWRSGSPQQRYPVARPGTSAHEYGLAVDMTFKTPVELQFAIDLAPYFNMKWAGSKDPVHFASTSWKGGTEESTSTPAAGSGTCVFGICANPECDAWATWARQRAVQVARQYGVSNRDAEALVKDWIEYYYPAVAETCSGYFDVLAESPF